MCKPTDWAVKDSEALNYAYNEHMSVRSAMNVPIDDMELAGCGMPDGKYWEQWVRHANEHYIKAQEFLRQAIKYQEELEQKIYQLERKLQ